MRPISRVFRIFLPLALGIAAAAQTPAQPGPTAQAPHLSVTLLVPPSQIYPGQSFTAGLDFRMDPGWHIYWVNAGDSGEPPSVNWTLPKGVAASSMQFPAPQRLPLGPLMDFGYQHEVVFPVPMRVAPDFHPSAPQATFGASLHWLVCANVCIPGHADVSLTRSALAPAPAAPQTDSAAQNLIAQFQSRLPQPLPSADSAVFQSTPKSFLLGVSTGARFSSAKFFPLDQSVVANAAPQPATPLVNGVQLTLAKDDSLQTVPARLNGVIELPNGKAWIIHATPGTLPAVAASVAPGGLGPLAEAVLLAFFGGIILNLMPCVFPVLFIKALALVRSGQEERRRLRAHGWVYTLGILVSFWIVVAVLLGLRAAGQQLGWGFQFQSPTFLALIALLFFFLGLTLAGQFEFGLSLTSAGGSLAQKHGYAGSFFTGVLAMVVATPCTAPFMGAAIGYGLAHSAATSFAVFTAIALGLAAPYLLLAYNPAWNRVLPKPGAWMETLKQIFAVPIFLIVAWLVWVFTQVAGTSALFALLVAFVLLAIAGWFLGRWPARAAATLAAALVAAVAIAVSLWAIRSFPAPASATATATAKTSAWQPYTPALVSKYRAEGRPVFVDFTASWCLSCQVNERLILDNPQVEQKLQQSGVALVRADWTTQDPAITQALAALGRDGVPTYAIYPGSPSAPPHVLPEVLTRGIVIDALSALPASPQQSAALNPPPASHSNPE